MGMSCCGGGDTKMHKSSCEVVDTEHGFGAIAFYVESVAKTVEFYKKVFGGVLLFADPEEEFAAMKVHGLNIQFIDEAAVQKQYDRFIPNRMKAEKSAGMEIIFPVDDSVGYYNDIVAKAKLDGYDIEVVSPVMQSWGAVCGWVSDNNGIMISITGKMSESGCC